MPAEHSEMQSQGSCRAVEIKNDLSSLMPNAYALHVSAFFSGVQGLSLGHREILL